jgi:hypothetical protein
MSMKIIAIVDRHALPFSVSTQCGGHHEVRLVELCFDFYMIEAKPENLIGDRVNDSDPLPHRGNRSKPSTQDRRRDTCGAGSLAANGNAGSVVRMSQHALPRKTRDTIDCGQLIILRPLRLCRQQKLTAGPIAVGTSHTAFGKATSGSKRPLTKGP